MAAASAFGRAVALLRRLPGCSLRGAREHDRPRAESLVGPVTAVNGSTIEFLLDFEALHSPPHDHETINRRLGRGVLDHKRRRYPG